MVNMAGFTQVKEFLKNGVIFFDGEAYIFLNLSIECLQPNYIYQLRVKIGPCYFCMVPAIVTLV